MILCQIFVRTHSCIGAHSSNNIAIGACIVMRLVAITAILIMVIVLVATGASEDISVERSLIFCCRSMDNSWRFQVVCRCCTCVEKSASHPEINAGGVGVCCDIITPCWVFSINLVICCESRLTGRVSGVSTELGMSDHIYGRDY